MAEDVRVIRQTTETVFDDNGKPAEKIRVEFKVGESGPFYLRFPAENFNGLNARQQIDAFARELRNVKGT